jgi:hypothetical protein
MTIKTRSTWTFFILLAILALAAGLNAFLPQGERGTLMPESQIPKWQLALGAAGITTALYGFLGMLGLALWRNLDFPEIWAKNVSARQRFLIPALAGGALGLVLIVADLVFSRINGLGRLMHPPFPTSLVASVSAGIGEELLFRLFFVSFWTWLVGKVLLRGRSLTVVYWVASTFSALAFGASHLPTLMILTGITDPALFSPVLLLQIFLLNGLISLVAAYYFKKYGFLAPVGVHFWTDIVWHMLWGLF